MKLPKLVSLASVLLLGLISPSLALAATLALNPANGTLNTGCSYSIDAMLDTGGINTDGTDLIVLYDQSRFTVTSLTKGTIYPDYPAASADTSNGRISISGIASPTQPYTNNGPTKFATINFTIPQTAPSGAANLTIDFAPGTTTHSNVVQTSTVTNVLSSVVNGNYTIATGGSCGSPTPSPSSSGGIGASPTPGTGSAIIKLPPSPGKGGPGVMPTTAGEFSVLGVNIAPPVLLTFLGGVLTVIGLAGLAI